MRYKLSVPARVNILGNPYDANEGDFATISAAVDLRAGAIVEAADRVILENLSQEPHESVQEAQPAQATSREEYEPGRAPLPYTGELDLLIAREFLDYVRGAEVIIHNAGFDLEFLDLELERAALGKFGEHVAGVIDSLMLARELHPGKRNSLDALCERYAIDNAHRTLHGALLDARLLAEVYLAMTRGQESLAMDLETPADAAAAAARIDASTLIVLRASPEELAAHEKYLDGLAKEAAGAVVCRKA